ncbi:MAG: hypothetical protein ACKV2Q_21875 [Planctomycetaceae bacterium]
MSLAPTPSDIPASTEKPVGLTWPKFRRWAIRRLIVLTVSMTLYVLSIGPMWWAWFSGMHVSTERNYWVIAFYEPLRLLCQIEWINTIVTAYIEWWNL